MKSRSIRLPGSTEQGRPKLNEEARILVIRLGAIGDVANALVFATALKDTWPGISIGWAVHDLCAPLVRAHPSVDRVHLWPRGSGRAGYKRLVRELQHEGYELAVDLQRTFKSAWLARRSGAGRVLGYDRARAKEFSWLFTSEKISAGPADAHMVEQYMQFAHELGATAKPRHVLPSDAAAEAWAAEFVDGLSAAPILINLGASKPANRWEPERFGQLAAGLSGLKPVCLLGGPDDLAAAERALAAARSSNSQSADWIRNLADQTSLLELIALQRRSSLFVGCDTGPMHLAAAVDLPVVALFGPADPKRTGPFGWDRPEPRHIVVREDLECAPCEKKQCPLKHHACMQDLSVERVAAACRAALHS